MAIFFHEHNPTYREDCFQCCVEKKSTSISERVTEFTIYGHSHSTFVSQVQEYEAEVHTKTFLNLLSSFINTTTVYCDYYTVSNCRALQKEVGQPWTLPKTTPNIVKGFKEVHIFAYSYSQCCLLVPAGHMRNQSHRFLLFLLCCCWQFWSSMTHLLCLLCIEL